MRTIISVLIIGAVLWFAIANAAVVDLKLFVWDLNASLAIVIAVAFFLGFFLGILYLAPSYFKQRQIARKHERALRVTEKERDEYSGRSAILEEQMDQMTPSENNKSLER